MVAQAKRMRLQRKATWQTALAEHRVVQYMNGVQLTAYNTAQEALKAVDAARKTGMPADIVVLPAEEVSYA